MKKKSEPKLALCIRCGFAWVPRVVKPAACPFCKSYKWDTAIVTGRKGGC